MGNRATAPNETRGSQDKEEKESQGTEKLVHEAEYCHYEGELQDKKKHCKKNPTHEGFIAVNDLKREHLPQGYRDNLSWQFLQTVIYLTVRVVVNYTSMKRPEFNYPNSEDRGCFGMTLGSGLVWSVYRMSTEKGHRTCQCKECQLSPDKAKLKWALFRVRTAKHVVFNTEECKQTRCNIGYDRDEDRGNCDTLDGLEVKYSDIERDWCSIWCVSHKEDVINKMEMMVRRYEDLCGKLDDKYKRSRVVDIDKGPVICVSHPHGMAKQITVGRCTGQQKKWPWPISYTTKTCKGSSGAGIWCLGGVRNWWDGVVLAGDRCHHSGSLPTGDNQSGDHGLWW